MNLTDLGLIVAVVILLAVSGLRSRDKTKKGLVLGAKQFWNVLPFFLAVFALVGLLEVLVTPQQVQAWLGSGAGMLAPFYAALLGGLGTGPPASVFPLGQFLLAKHATVAAVSTLLIAWVAVGTVTLPAEIRFFGARFALTRWTLTFVLSIALGLLMGWIL
ncbi:MAG: hypothetical protein P4L93_08265 [Coriobacteriia bacterium]|nr:hypothetical protein [Coriobacteriia bacterium]